VFDAKTGTPAPVLGAGPPLVPAAGGAGPITVVEGTTFCMSGATGDVVPGTPHGLFFRDARVLSRWELRLDGEPPHPLSVTAPEAFAARFVLRRPPQAGLADSTLLVVRERLIGNGMHEAITLTNLGREATALTVTVHVDADFADLFAVKEGRTPPALSHAEVRGAELLLTRADGSRGLRITATSDPLITPGSLVWRTVIPPRGSWTTEVLAHPTIAIGESQHRRPDGIEATAAARKIRDWRRASARINADDPVLAQVLRRSEDDLGALRIESGSGHAFIAAGAPWFMTLFGRDSLLTGWMTLPLNVGLALGTLETLARVQGRRVDPLTEEEPGRILHELRLGPDNDETLGGSHYYGTIDATPLFVMLLAECLRWGADPQRVRALLPAADAALDWIQRYGDRDGDGFVEYQRATDRGLANQGWKDSFDAISDRAGRLAEAPIALCEVQGYVYGAYLARGYLAETLEHDPVAAARWRGAAARLRTAFHERFWLPDVGWYALGLDAHKRPVDALASNVAHALWTGIATDGCAAVLVSRLAGADMDSGYGLRTLSAGMGRYNPMSYHNGSVWPHDTALAVAGLLRYAHLPGAVEVAHRLTEGLLDAAAAFGARLPELFCGFPRTEFDPPVPYPTSCSPQAWASAAPLLLVRAFLGLDPDVPHRRLDLAPRIPDRWGRLNLGGLRLGDEVAHIHAHPDGASVGGLPEDWTIGDPSAGRRVPHEATTTRHALPVPRKAGGPSAA
jgi:glycogen debranching enzyme